MDAYCEMLKPCINKHVQYILYDYYVCMYAGLGMMCGQQPVTVLSPVQIKKKEAWVGNEKPCLKIKLCGLILLMQNSK